MHYIILIRSAIRNFLLTMLTIMVALFGVQFSTVHSQTSEPSPTPAPPKTETAEAATQTPPSSSATDLRRTFTQQDLSVLTGNIQRPNGMTWHDGMVYLSCTGDWTLYEINTETNVTVPYLYGVRNAHTLFAMSTERGVDLWVPDFQSNNLTLVSGGTSRIIAPNLEGPWGIAGYTADESTRFLITNLRADNVVSVSMDGDTEQVIQNLISPTGIVVDESFVYVANTGSARRAIEWFALSDLENGVVDAAEDSASRSLVSGLQNVTNMTLASDGYLYLGYALGTRGVVGRVDPEQCRDAGGCSADQVEIVIYTELAAPLAGITVSPDLRIFLHSIYSPEIYWVDLNA
jgi:hypothetical protein